MRIFIDDVSYIQDPKMNLVLPDLGFEHAALLASAACGVVVWIVGPTGKFLAKIAFAGVAASALAGRTSWGMATMLAIGIAAMVGSGRLIEASAADPVIGSCFYNANKD